MKKKKKTKTKKKKNVEKERRRQRRCGDDIENSVLQFRGARSVRFSNA